VGISHKQRGNNLSGTFFKWGVKTKQRGGTKWGILGTWGGSKLVNAEIRED